MGVTFASLQSISNSPVLTRFLNISANGSSISFALSFRNVGCSPSGPVLFGSFCTLLISSILSWHEPYFLQYFFLLGKLISASDICLTSSVSTGEANVFYFQGYISVFIFFQAFVASLIGHFLFICQKCHNIYPCFLNNFLLRLEQFFHTVDILVPFLFLILPYIASYQVITRRERINYF